MPSHKENKNRLWGVRARYFIAALCLMVLGGGIFFVSYHYGQRTARPQTTFVVDPAIESAFFALFSEVRQPEAQVVFPAFRYIDPQGNARRFRVGRNEFVLLNIWATWCPPCVVELPDLEKLQARLPENTAVRVIAVSVDQQKDHAALVDFLKARGIGLAAAHHEPDGIIMRNAPIHGLPTSFLLAQGGEILYIFEGAALWADPAALAFFHSFPTAR